MLTIPGWEPEQLRVSDRLSLRYVKLGEGSPVVLLHTIRTQIEYFRELAPLLAQKHTVYLVDLPGHGRSSIDPDAPCDEPYMRAAIVSFLEKLNLRDVIMV